MRTRVGGYGSQATKSHDVVGKLRAVGFDDEAQEIERINDDALATIELLCRELNEARATRDALAGIVDFHRREAARTGWIMLVMASITLASILWAILT